MGQNTICSHSKASYSVAREAITPEGVIEKFQQLNLCESKSSHQMLKAGLDLAERGGLTLDTLELFKNVTVDSWLLVSSAKALIDEKGEGLLEAWKDYC